MVNEYLMLRNSQGFRRALAWIGSQDPASAGKHAGLLLGSCPGEGWLEAARNTDRHFFGEVVGGDLAALKLMNEILICHTGADHGPVCYAMNGAGVMSRTRPWSYPNFERDLLKCAEAATAGAIHFAKAIIAAHTRFLLASAPAENWVAEWGSTMRLADFYKVLSHSPKKVMLAEMVGLRFTQASLSNEYATTNGLMIGPQKVFPATKVVRDGELFLRSSFGRRSGTTLARVWDGKPVMIDTND